MKQNRKAYQSFERDLHDSEQAFFQGIAELYSLRWITTSRIKRMYFERVAFYGACCRFRLAMAQLNSGQVVLMWLDGGQGFEVLWSPYIAEIWDNGHKPVLGRNSHRKGLTRNSNDPVIWNENTQSTTDLIDLTHHIGARRKKRFEKRLTSWCGA